MYAEAPSRPPAPSGPARPSAALLGLALLAAAGLMAADPGSSTRTPRGPVDDATLQRLLELHHTEQEQVRLVLVPGVVTNKRGKLIRGLKADDFELFEDQVPQQIKYFTSEVTEPISIAFLLDLSGSMRQLGKLDEAIESIRFFVDTLREGDQFGLIGFADQQVTWITEFTTDRERFLKRLSVQEAYGQTALYDAVAATPGLVDTSIRGRKAIVLITDGIDNASDINTFAATRLARSVQVPIYSIGFSSLPRKMLARGSKETILRVLELFSYETGGELFTVHDPDDLKEAVSRIEQELRFHYVIGYYPTRTDWDGEFRRIRLATTRDAYRVRTRQGYYATP